MMGYTHKLGGLTSGTVAAIYLIEQPITVEKLIMSGCLIGFSVFGSLIPDIDHTNSTISKNHKITSKIVHFIFGHRGATHAPIIVALFTALLFFLSRFIPVNILQYYMISVYGLFIGMMSHLVLDAITVAGIPMFYPFSRKCIHIASFKSSKHNGIVCLLLIIGATALISFKLFI